MDNGIRTPMDQIKFSVPGSVLTRKFVMKHFKKWWINNEDNSPNILSDKTMY